MLDTEVKCPKCHHIGYIRVIGWHGEDGFDPLMVKVKCRHCGMKFFVAPPPWYKVKEKEENYA